MIDEKENLIPVEEDEDFIELVDQEGRHLKFFHVGSTEYMSKWYAFFMPAEEIEGLAEDEVVIYEVAEENGAEILLPVDETSGVLEAVYEKFCKEMEEEADALEAEELEGGCCCGHDHSEGHHHHEDGKCCCGGKNHDEKGECHHGEGHHHHEDGKCCCGHDHGEDHKKGDCKRKNH